MDTLSKLRKWANRDDGRFYQIGNEPIDAFTIIGMLALIGALILWQLHSQIGIRDIWAAAAAAASMVLLLIGTRNSNGNGT